MSASLDTTAVVVGIDGGGSAPDALVWAAAEASATGRALRVVHALSWPLLADALGMLPVDRSTTVRAATMMLEEAAARARAVDPHLGVTIELCAARDLAVALTAGTGRDSMIVIGRGAAGRSRSSRRPLAVSLASRARCPIVIVALSDAVGTPLAGRVVGLSRDRVDEARVAIVGIREAKRRGVELTLLRSAEPPQSYAGAALVVMGLPRRPRIRREFRDTVGMALMAVTPVFLLPHGGTPSAPRAQLPALAG